MGYFFSRVAIRRDVPASAIWKQLAPDDRARRTMSSHSLIWTLFADRPDRARDFLWREAEPGRFFVLSARIPVDAHNLFDISPPVEFSPKLAEGDVLRFSLRANATVARKAASGGSRARGKPCDVVIDALRQAGSGTTRAEKRRDVVEEAGYAWLSRKASDMGFALLRGEDDEAPQSTIVVAHSVVTMYDSGRRIRLGVLDFEGLLRVSDPGKFIPALCAGFGRAKGFGCGLMLVRRA